MSVTQVAPSWISATIQGINGAGAIQCVGLKAGDMLISGNPNGINTWLEPVVTVNDQVQQVVNLDGTTLSGTVYFMRVSS